MHALKNIQLIYGRKQVAQNTFQPEVLTKIEQFIGDAMPSPIIQKLQESDKVLPWKIVNLFGGNSETLIQFICYNKPSLFLHKHGIYTRKLFTMSRILLQENFKKKEFPPHHWINKKKTPSFDNIFMNYAETEGIRILCDTREYYQDI